MKFCSKCGTQCDDNASSCPNCEAIFVASAAATGDANDHTAEFDPRDISDNKVICMLIYLAGYIGIFVALLMANTSKYVSFHIRQALKIEVVSLLFTLVSGIASVLIGLIALIPILGWIIAIVYCLVVLAVPVVLFIVKIMCFFQICKGQAKEPALLNKLPFLK